MPGIQGPLVFDTSALFNFGHRGEMDALLELLSREVSLMVPSAVLAEASEQTRNRAFYQDLLKRRFTVAEGRVHAGQGELITRMAQRLGTGEIGVIILAIETGGTAVIDDPEARTGAKHLGIQMTGTLGLMLMAVSREWLSEPEALEAAGRMRIRGFRIPPVKQGQSFAEYLKSIGG